MESAILPTIRIRNPVHPESTTWNTDSNNVLYYLTWSDMFHLRAGQIIGTVKII